MKPPISTWTFMASNTILQTIKLKWFEICRSNFPKCNWNFQQIVLKKFFFFGKSFITQFSKDGTFKLGKVSAIN
jgi:hypothetical protein